MDLSLINPLWFRIVYCIPSLINECNHIPNRMPVMLVSRSNIYKVMAVNFSPNLIIVDEGLGHVVDPLLSLTYPLLGKVAVL